MHRYDADIEHLSRLETNYLLKLKPICCLMKRWALIASYKKNMAATPSSSNSASTRKKRSPKLQLPSFTGLYTEWMSSIDLSRASVDGNNQLSDSEKLNYLKDCLVDDAAKLIASVTITNANYSIAMKLLNESNENKRCIVQAHLKALWTQPPMQSESVVGLRNGKTWQDFWTREVVPLEWVLLKNSSKIRFPWKLSRIKSPYHRQCMWWYLSRQSQVVILPIVSQNACLWSPEICTTKTSLFQLSSCRPQCWFIYFKIHLQRM